MIVSYIVSYIIVTCIISYCILYILCHIVSYIIVSCIIYNTVSVMSYFVILYLISLCILSYHIVSYHMSSYFIPSYLILSYIILNLISLSFQPVPHDWCNKGCGVCYPVCVMVHIKETLLLIRKSSLCGSSRFPLYLSGPLPFSGLTPYNRNQNVLSALLNKTFPSFLISLYLVAYHCI